MTNSRFEDLEKRVKIIKVKSYVKILFILSVIIGITYFILYYSSQTVAPQSLHVKNEVKKEVKKPAIKIQTYEPIKAKIKVEKKKIEVKKDKKIELKYDTIILSPTLNFPDEIQPEKRLEKIVFKEVTKLKPTKKSIIFLHVKEVKSEEALLERFRTATDFESAIGLASLYYEDNKFEKSVYWSKKASKLSSGDESAWLIYAKSKKALGKTDDAIKALHLYLEYFSSNEIERLLELYKGTK